MSKQIISGANHNRQGGELNVRDVWARRLLGLLVLMEWIETLVAFLDRLP